MTHYKPSMKLVLAAYIEGLSESKATKQALADEFDRWLASVKADAYRIGYKKATSDIVDEELSRKRQADAWDEGYFFEFERAEDNRPLANPYRGEQA